MYGELFLTQIKGTCCCVELRCAVLCYELSLFEYELFELLYSLYEFIPHHRNDFNYNCFGAQYVKLYVNLNEWLIMIC